MLRTVTRGEGGLKVALIASTWFMDEPLPIGKVDYFDSGPYECIEHKVIWPFVVARQNIISIDAVLWIRVNDRCG